MAVSVREVLALPVLRAGEPEVLCAPDQLDRPVRWVHISELADIGSLLSGGELILTTGVALPGSAVALRRYVATLGAAGACALVVELGRRFTRVPDAIVRAGTAYGLPVVALRRSVRFVEVTETVHARIINAQVDLLAASDRAHAEFTRLSVEGAPAAVILDKVAEMSGQAVVLEDLAHRVVAFSTQAGRPEHLLRDWEARSRRCPWTERTAEAGLEGWLTCPVGPRAQHWGRLVMPTVTGPAGRSATSATAATPAMLLERAAEALAINRLLERERAGLLEQAHRRLLVDLLERRVPGDDEARARLAALGLPTGHRGVLALAVSSQLPGIDDPVSAGRLDRQLAEAAAAAAEAAGMAALTASVSAGRGLLLGPAPAPSGLERVLSGLADALADRLEALAWPHPYAVAVAGPGPLGDAGGLLAEASHVAEVAVPLRASRPRPYYRHADVRLRGLLTLLRADPRVLGFAAAELGHLLAHDASHGSDLLGLLRDYFAAGGSKAVLARRVHLSRPALYARLAAIEKVLGVRLGDPESALALHVALLAHEVAAGPALPRP